MWRVCAALRIGQGAEGCPGAGEHGHPVGAVSALWLPAHPCVHGAPGTPYEHRACLAAMEPGWAASAEETPAVKDCRQSIPAAGPIGGEPGVDLRFRVRHHGHGAVVEVPDGGG